MSERKVLNKYYPPDFDPRKLPRLRLRRNRQFIIRIMAPMSMKCLKCGEYIYKGKKFNARQETVRNEDYLGLRIYRFYIKCPRCMSEITFKTDPKNADYSMEEGGKRCFDAAKLAARAKEKELEETAKEEEANPMLALEKRTKDSRLEMEALEKLEELKEINKRQADVDFGQLLETHNKAKEEDLIDLIKEEELDEQLTKETFKNKLITLKDIGENYNFSNLFTKSKNTKIEKNDDDNNSGIIIRKKNKLKKSKELKTNLLPGITSYDSDE